AEVHELERDVEIRALQQRDRRLQVVAALRLHAQLVALDLALDALRGLVADDLRDLLRVVAADALLDAGLDAVLLAARERLAGVEGPQRDAALDELLLEHVEHGLDALLGVRLQQDPALAAEFDRRADPLEVVPLRDLLLGLVDGVLQFHRVDLAHDVEGRIGHAAMVDGLSRRRPGVAGAGTARGRPGWRATAPRAGRRS